MLGQVTLAWDMWAQDFGHKIHMLAWDLLARDMLAQECGTRLVWTGGPIFWLYSSLEARQGRQRGSRGRSPRQAVNPCRRHGFIACMIHMIRYPLRNRDTSVTLPSHTRA